MPTKPLPAESKDLRSYRSMVERLNTLCAEQAAKLATDRVQHVADVADLRRELDSLQVRVSDLETEMRTIRGKMTED